MHYRKLGNTNMSVSILGFGASSLGGVFHPLDEEEGIEAVISAIELGINFIDVSPYYGHLKAEIVLGKALKQIKRSRFYLSTKVGRYGRNGVSHWDYTRKTVTESVFESMDRLNTDYLDLINVHDIEFADLEQVCQETLPALLELKELGIVKHLGISNLNLRHFVYVIDHVPKEMVSAILSFCHYTLNDDSLVDYLDYLEAKGVGVINASPYSMGLLTKRGTPDWHPAPAALKRLARKAVAFCESKGVPIEQLAVSFAVNNPRIATTLFSTTRAENVRKTIEYAESECDMELLRDVRAIFEPGFRDSWVNS